MVDKVGAIEYTVSADTAQMLKAEAVMDKSLASISKSFDKADQAVREFEKTQKAAGSTINRLGQVINKNGDIVEDATIQYRKLASEASGSFNKLSTTISKTAKGVNNGLSSIGRTSGQAGIQFQQFIGQIQGGQNAMVALSAQAADLGFVLGAPLIGAIVGIGASVIGMATAFGKVKVEMKSTSDIAKELVGDFSALDEESKKLTRRILIADIKNQEKALEQLKEEQRDAIGLGATLFNSIEENSAITSNYTANVLSLELALKQSKKTLATLGKDSSDYSNVLNDQQVSIGNLITSTVHLANTYGFNARELSIYEAELRGANAAQLAALNLTFDTIEAKERESAAIKKQNDERGRLTGQVQGLGLSPIDQIKARLDYELELLRQAQEQKIEIEGSYEERRVELRRQAEERIASINEKAAQESIVNFEALENQIVGTFASVASGAQDGKQAVRSLAQSIATQLIGALIKMGIQAAIGQTTAAATGAATAATLATAYAPAAALASLASFGANAAPASAGIASTVALTQGLSLSGGRQYGGPTTKGSNYRVNENGPEIYTQGGKDYLMNSGGGTVTPNSNIGGSQSVQVVVNNLPGQGATVTETSSDDGRMRQIAIQVVSEQSASIGSDLNRNINKNHNVTNRQSANRRN